MRKPLKPRKAAARLRKHVSSHEPMNALLPLTHITRAYSFDEIVDGDQFDPTHCEVFKEELIYFFTEGQRTGLKTAAMLT